MTYFLELDTVGISEKPVVLLWVRRKSRDRTLAINNLTVTFLQILVRRLQHNLTVAHAQNLYWHSMFA